MSQTKLIFLDIDGTIINEKGFIPQSAIDAIACAKANGHRIFVNTGRGKKEIPTQLQKLALDGMVAASGCYVEAEGEILLNTYMKLEDVEELIDYFEKYDIVYIVSADGNLYGTPSHVADQTECMRIFAGETKGGLDVLRSFLDSMHVVRDPRKVEKVNKLLFYHSPVPLAQIKQKFGGRMNVVAGSYTHIMGECGEINDKSISKAVGIQKIVDHYGLSVEDTFAFGDGENDLEMIRFAGTGVAMGNADDCVKEAADYVTAPVGEDGLYQAFLHFGLIGQTA